MENIFISFCVCFLIISYVCGGCPNDCSGHGKCNNDKCECDSYESSSVNRAEKTKGELKKYTGSDCSISIFFAITMISSRNVSLW